MTLKTERKKERKTFLPTEKISTKIKRSDLVHWEDLEGSGGEGGGRGDRDVEHM